MEVKTDLRKVLYGALTRVLPNPSDAPVVLVISRWPITLTTKFIEKSLKKNYREVNSAVFKKNATGPGVCMNRSLKQPIEMLSTEKSV